jgi:hypothetical protein
VMDGIAQPSSWHNPNNNRIVFYPARRNSRG